MITIIDVSFFPISACYQFPGNFSVSFKDLFMYAVFKVQVPADLTAYGDEEIRTLDPLLARQVLSQLSYIPVWVPYSISCDANRYLRSTKLSHRFRLASLRFAKYVLTRFKLCLRLAFIKCSQHGLKWTFAPPFRFIQKSSGLKWTRTTDLTLIRRAL